MIILFTAINIAISAYMLTKIENLFSKQDEYLTRRLLELRDSNRAGMDDLHNLIMSKQETEKLTQHQSSFEAMQRRALREGL